MKLRASKSLPNGWASAPIDELVGSGGLFCDGDWVESKDQDPNGSVRLIQLADIGDGEFRDKSSRFLTADRAKELACSYLKKDDILVARMPDPLGRACIFPLDGSQKYVTVVDVCIVRTGTASISNEYLSYIINSPAARKEIESYKTGSTRKRISRKNLARISLPIAPLNEQYRIVAKIEELFSELEKGVESLKAAKAQLAVYRQVVLKTIFEGDNSKSWKQIQIGEIANAINGRAFKSSEWKASGLPIIRIQNLKDKFAPFNCFDGELNPKHRVKHGDLLFAWSGTPGTSFGAHIWSGGDAVLNQHIFKLIIDEKYINTKFLCFSLNQNVAKYIAQAQGGVGLAHITKRKFDASFVRLPNLKEQEKIVQEIESRLSVVEKMEQTIEESLQKAEALRQSILKRAFEGKLVPQDPSDERASELLARIRAERAAGSEQRGRRAANVKHA